MNRTSSITTKNVNHDQERSPPRLRADGQRRRREGDVPGVFEDEAGIGNTIYEEVG